MAGWLGSASSPPSVRQPTWGSLAARPQPPKPAVFAVEGPHLLPRGSPERASERTTSMSQRINRRTALVRCAAGLRRRCPDFAAAHSRRHPNVRVDVRERVARRADRLDQAGALRPVHRAHRRRGLRRHLGRAELQGAEHRRHSPRAGRACPAVGKNRDPLAGRLLRRRLRLARRDWSAAKSGLAASAAGRKSPSRTSSARTSSSSSVGCAVRSRIWPATWARGRPSSFNVGSNTATPRPARRRSPTSAWPTATTIRFASTIGVSATRAGAAAASSRRRITARNIAASLNGCPATACRSTSSLRGRTATTSTGRGGSSKSGKITPARRSPAGPHTTTAARPVTRSSSRSTNGTKCWRRPTAWSV